MLGACDWLLGRLCAAAAVDTDYRGAGQLGKHLAGHKCEQLVELGPQCGDAG